jgi:hypothetical protein
MLGPTEIEHGATQITCPIIGDAQVVVQVSVIHTGVNQGLISRNGRSIFARFV